MSENRATGFWDQQYADLGVRSALLQKRTHVFKACLDFFGDVAGKSALDIGCGLGEFSIRLATLGARVTAIDLSETAVAKLGEYAAEKRLSIDCRVLDARNIDQLEQFDYVFGSFILHHIEPFDAFCNALHSAMTPGGKAFFEENNAASSLLVWARNNLVGRYGIPKFGDEDEFPLTPDEVDMLKRRFNVTQLFPEMFLFRLVSVYLLKRRGIYFFKGIDNLLNGNKLLSKYSYRQLVLLEKSQ